MKKRPLDTIDLKSLRCFLEAATRNSLTRAGIELGISESAVSQRVRALERQLGVKLYESRGGKIHLTPAGERTVALALSVFDEVEAFEHAIHDAETEITLCTTDSVLRYLLPEVIEAFQQAHSHSRLRLKARSLVDTYRIVRANEADLGIVPVGGALPNDLTLQPFATFPAYLVLPKGHALVRRARQDFFSMLNTEIVDRYPLIVAEVQNELGLLREAMARRGLPLKMGLEVGTIETLKHYVSRGMGIGLISGLCVTDEDRAHLETCKVPDALGADTTYGVVMRRNKHRSAALEALLRMLVKRPT